MGRYAEAKNCFLKGQEHQDEMGIKQWITWCDEKMQKLGIKDDPDEVKETQKPKVVSCENEKADLQDEKTKTDTPPSTDNAERSSKQENQAVAMPVPKIKHDWYQTETQVILDNIAGTKKRQRSYLPNPPIFDLLSESFYFYRL